MNASKISVSICTSLLLLFSCSNDDLDLPTRIERNLTGELSIKCPFATICDENFSYRAYTYEDAKIVFDIFFETSIINNLNTTSFKEAFRFAQFTIKYPELDRPDVNYTSFNREAIRSLGIPTSESFEIVLIDYKEGRLRGYLQGNIKTIFENITSDDPNCTSGDIVGLCQNEIATDIDMRIDFDLIVEMD